jgi:VanZ family protein
MLVAVVVLSLVRVEQPVQLENVDKYEHLLAYGSLMFWWGMVQPARRRFWFIALPVLGIGMELLQSLTPHRFMSWNDALANLLGVLLGSLLLRTPAARVLGVVDRQIRNRFDPGSP